MNLTNIPPFASVPFANGAGSGYRNTIPATTTTPGAASMAVGFPPECFEPIASGGIPPGGADFNGILYAYGVQLRWKQAGGNYPFDATFAAAIGGYPKDAIVMRADGLGQWLNTVDGNSTDPDSASSAGWIELRANTGATTIAAVAGNNTPTPNQLGAQALLVTGSLGSNATLTLPLRAGAQWLVVNNTTGAGTLTVQGTTGAGVSIAQGVGQIVYTDGVGYFSTSASVAGQYLPINGTAVAATKLATARNFSITGGVTAAAVSFDGTGNAVLNVTAIPGNAATATKWASAITLSLTGVATGSGSVDGSGNVSIATSVADGVLSIAKTSGLQAALDAKAPTANPAFTGVVTAAAIQNGAGGGTAGYQLLWNVVAAGLGRTEFINNDASGGGHFAFYGRHTTAGGLTQLMLIDGIGNVSIPGSLTAGGGFQNSDRRLKTNIKPRDVQRGFALKIARMFCEWDRIADGVHDVGLVAQRVKALASRYVIRGEGKKGRAGMLAIDKAGIALEASMDCALQLAEQEKTIKALLRRIQKLEKQA